MAKPARTILLAIIALGTLIVSGRSAMTLANVGQGQGTANAEIVMTVGSSVAEGWVDTQGGYLVRAFASLGKTTGHPYRVVRRAYAGDYSTKVAPEYVKWLATVHPQVVVISWGGLDDIEAKTPLPNFRAAVRTEIKEALDQRAVVVVVTSPVTRATYTQFPKSQAQFMNAEMAVARSFKSPNVVVADVFDQMKAYLIAHHQTYVPYMADGWHPNAAGHRLAGQLLFADMRQSFGIKSIQFTH